MRPSGALAAGALGTLFAERPIAIGSMAERRTTRRSRARDIFR
jgi:hypothetical protein